MKTVFRIAMMLCVCLLCAHVSFAEEPWFSAERYYQGDPNYVLVQERQEVRMYVDVSSIVSKIYEPPEYEISAVVMVVGPQPGAQRFLTETWHYHYDPQYRNRQMFVWDEQRGDWRRVPKFGDADSVTANTVLVRPGGEFVWWKCYQMDFYYNQK